MPLLGAPEMCGGKKGGYGLRQTSQITENIVRVEKLLVWSQGTVTVPQGACVEVLQQGYLNLSSSAAVTSWEFEAKCPE